MKLKTGTYYDGTSAGSSGGTNLLVDTTNDKIYGVKAYDLCNNSAIDAGLWTTNVTGAGSVAENTTALTVSTPIGTTGTASAITNDLSNTKAADCRITVLASVTGAPSAAGVLQISDGTNHITLFSRPAGGIVEIYEIRYNKSADTVDFYTNGFEITADIDVSSLSDLKIRAYINDGSAVGGGTVAFQGVFSSTIAGTPTWISDDETETDVGNFTRAGIYVKTETLNNGTSVYKLSADGTNYDEVTLDSYRYGIVDITTTGKHKRVKIELTTSSTITDDLAELSDYYAIWDDEIEY